MYSSDVGKMIGCFVFYVNGDNLEVSYVLCCNGFYLNLKGGGVFIGKYYFFCFLWGWGEYSVMFCMKIIGY